MSDWPLNLVCPNHEMISTFSQTSAFSQVASVSNITAVSAAWSVANRAFFVPVRVEIPITIRTMGVYNGAAVSGNFDVGIYNEVGKCIVTKGSTAQAGTSVVQTVDVTTGISGGTASPLLTPGLYFLAMSMDNLTGTNSRLAGNTFSLMMCGLRQQQSAFPLPTTSATFATPSVNYAPGIGATQKTVM